MNWMICYDYGKDGNHVFSEMIENKDTAADALKAYQEKYDDNEARIVAVVPVNKDVFENYYNLFLLICIYFFLNYFNLTQPTASQ